VTNNEHGSRIKFTILAAIPVVLSIALATTVIGSDPEGWLGTMFLGWLLTIFVCPLYLAILCCYCTIRKSLLLNYCMGICFLMNACTNFAFYCIYFILTGSIFIGAAHLWMMQFLAISIAVMSACLFVVWLIKRRYDNKTMGA